MEDMKLGFGWLRRETVQVFIQVHIKWINYKLTHKQINDKVSKLHKTGATIKYHH